MGTRTRWQVDGELTPFGVLRGAGSWPYVVNSGGSICSETAPVQVFTLKTYGRRLNRSPLMGPFKGINKENKVFAPYLLYKIWDSKRQVFGFCPASWRV